MKLEKLIVTPIDLLPFKRDFDLPITCKQGISKFGLLLELIFVSVEFVVIG